MPPLTKQITKQIFASLACALLLSSCDDPVPASPPQDIGNAVWRSNNAMLTFVEKRDFVSGGDFIYKLYEADGEGKLGKQLWDEDNSDPVPFLAVSPDGNTALTVLSSKLYRLDLVNGTRTQLTTNVTRVFAASPDLRFVLLTHAGLYNPIKTVSLLDVSGDVVRSVKEWRIKGLQLGLGYWLKNDEIALNLDTASRPFVTIFDTTGAILRSFANAQTPARSSAYTPESNSLFVKNYESLEQLNVETGQRVNIADTYVNLDARGNTLAYIEKGDGKNKIFIRNISTGETIEVGNDAFRFVILSPDATKLAYLVEPRANYNELKVISVTTP